MANYKSKSLLVEPEDGKKVLAPQVLHDQIKNGFKGGLILGLLISFIAFLVFGMIVFVLTIAESNDYLWLRILKFVLFITPFLLAASVVISYIVNLKHLLKGGYALIIDTVSRVVADDKLRRERGRRRTYYMEHAMYLQACGRVVISLHDNYLTAEGDRFYVAVDKKHPETPLLVYNSKYYELEDIE